jgi:hypothetical protein
MKVIIDRDEHWPVYSCDVVSPGDTWADDPYYTVVDIPDADYQQYKLACTTYRDWQRYLGKLWAEENDKCDV